MTVVGKLHLPGQILQICLFLSNCPLYPQELMSRVLYKGPTVLVVKDSEGNVFGAHASTSWCDTQDGWVGNGERLTFY